MTESTRSARALSRRDFLKRSALLGAGLTALPAVLAACAPAGTGTAAGGETAAQPAGEAVTLTWFVRDDPIVNPWEDEITARFHEANPNITVEWISGGTGVEREAKFTALFAGGTPPDIFSSWQEAGFGDYAARNLMLNLSPFIENSSDLDLSTIPEALMMTFQREGQQMAIPFASGASYLFYNKTAFDEAGVEYPTTDWDDPNWNWDALIEMATKLTQNYGNPDALYGTNIGLWPSNAIQWLFDADLFAPEAYETGFFTESQANSENSILAYQSQADLMWVHQVSPSPSLTDAMSAVGNPFKTGRLAMNMTGVWGFWSYSDVTAFEIGAAALPVGKNYNKPVIFTDPWMIARETKHPEEAWAFVKMLSDPKQGAKDYMELTGVVPPAAELLPLWYEKIGERMPWIAGDPLKQLIEGSMEHGYESANHLLVGFNAMESMINAERQAIFLNTKPAAEVMQTIKEKLDALAAETRKQFGIS